MGVREAERPRCRGSLAASTTAPRRSVLRGERPPRPQAPRRQVREPRIQDAGNFGPFLRRDPAQVPRAWTWTAIAGAVGLAASMPAGAGAGRGAAEAQDADPAPRRHLPGEPLVRRVLRDVSRRRSIRPGSRRSARGRGTPSVNGLTPTLIERNPNSSKPFRIDRLQSYTCDQDHEYTAEQRARNGGLMDQFPRFDAQPPTNARQFCHKTRRGAVGHGDGLLRRQHRDRALELRAALRPQRQQLRDDVRAVDARRAEPDGGRHLRRAVRAADRRSTATCRSAAARCRRPATPAPTNGKLGTFVDDTDPYWDVCSEGKPAALTGRNIGDLLTAAGVTWGWFQGGFTRAADGKCSPSHPLEAFDRAVGVDPRTDPLRFQDYVPAPQPVSVLRVDRESAPPAADVGGDGGQDRSGEASLRPQVVLGGGASGQPARRVLPEGAGLPERAPGQLEPARRAGVPGRRR